ncbi:hypothetical protein PHSY_002335 [Pseudozyma hubeiensis SY62]|uniref:Uncharacterized protein n=1 Tax=Pseudozyma hubeiensis (strain SY62) TaxID=1305764 RepID=R9P0Z4_PSEHS|nr:hypothetical protein PHSY_002335 [Pseudozyma hubeiensis SY62]GAC94762.1 hypothetical protein PHSY_002335 [Pseudozyma hubeiensis SY62]
MFWFRILSLLAGAVVIAVLAATHDTNSNDLRAQEEKAHVSCQKGWAQNFDFEEFERLGGINDDVFARYMAGNSSHTSGANMWVLSQMGLLTNLTAKGPDPSSIEIYRDERYDARSRTCDLGPRRSARAELEDKAQENDGKGNEVSG